MKRKHSKRSSHPHKAAVPASVKKHITAISKHADALKKATTKKR